MITAEEAGGTYLPKLNDVWLVQPLMVNDFPLYIF